jgi:hypothetical protein
MLARLGLRRRQYSNLLGASTKFRKATGEYVMSVCLSVCPSVRMSLSVCLSVRPYVSVRLFVRPYVSVRLSVRPPVCPSVRTEQLGSPGTDFHEN